MEIKAEDFTILYSHHHEKNAVFKHSKTPLHFGFITIDDGIFCDIYFEESGWLPTQDLLLDLENEFRKLIGWEETGTVTASLGFASDSKDESEQERKPAPSLNDLADPEAPAHYAGLEIQPWAVMEQCIKKRPETVPMEACFNVACSIKYLIRAGRKEGESWQKDVKKAITLLNRALTGGWK